MPRPDPLQLNCKCAAGMHEDLRTVAAKLHHAHDMADVAEQSSNFFKATDKAQGILDKRKK